MIKLYAYFLFNEWGMGFVRIKFSLSAKCILQLWTELEDKHCQYYYEYDKENLIQSRSFSVRKIQFIATFLDFDAATNQVQHLTKDYYPQLSSILHSTTYNNTTKMTLPFICHCVFSIFKKKSTIFLYRHRRKKGDNSSIN